MDPPAFTKSRLKKEIGTDDIDQFHAIMEQKTEEMHLAIDKYNT
jgi:hypothetical protein